MKKTNNDIVSDNEESTLQGQNIVSDPIQENKE